MRVEMESEIYANKHFIDLTTRMKKCEETSNAHFHNAKNEQNVANMPMSLEDRERNLMENRLYIGEQRIINREQASNQLIQNSN